jgi:hypothetical protein
MCQVLTPSWVRTCGRRGTCCRRHPARPVRATARHTWDTGHGPASAPALCRRRHARLKLHRIRLPVVLGDAGVHAAHLNVGKTHTCRLYRRLFCCARHTSSAQRALSMCHPLLLHSNLQGCSLAQGASVSTAAPADASVCRRGSSMAAGAQVSVPIPMLTTMLYAGQVTRRPSIAALSAELSSGSCSGCVGQTPIRQTHHVRPDWCKKDGGQLRLARAITTCVMHGDQRPCRHGARLIASGRGRCSAAAVGKDNRKPAFCESSS